MKYVVNGLVLINDKILLVKNKHLERPGNDFWSLPGGGVEDGESLKQAMEREMLEETGVKAKVGTLLFIDEYKLEDGSWGAPRFLFLIENPKDFINVDFSKASNSFELSNIKFFPITTNEEIKPTWLLKKLPNIDPNKTEYVLNES